MAKDKTIYVCSNCGQESPKWIGKCPQCGEWNTFKELRVAAETSSFVSSMSRKSSGAQKPMLLKDISSQDEPRIDMGDEELNPIQVSIQQFYGIEINDFAVTVAKTALWIA